MDNAKNWWSQFKMMTATATLIRVSKAIGRLVFKMMIAGLVINIIAHSFYPELPNRFPVIYGLFDGCLQFGEFLIKLTIRVIYLIVTLKWGEIFNELGEATTQFGALLNQLSSWLMSIHF